MAQNVRPDRARNARTVSRFTKFLGAAALTAIAYVGMPAAAYSPEPQVTAALKSAEIPAELSYAGHDVIITGSVSSLFSDATFSSASNDDKPILKRPTDEALEVASAFDAVRFRIASLREGAKKMRPVAEETPPISVAAIDPALGSAAIAAIDAIDGTKDSSQPLPASLPTQLAYARDNTPATSFETPISGKLDQKSMWCLATAIYFEARGESYRGQVAVAQVVMNRVNHPLYPSTVCGVVFQNQTKRNACQFSFACDGIPERVTEKEPWAQAQEIAQKVANGSLYLTEVANATHYHASYVYPRWAPRMKRMTTIGLHKFYRFKNGWTQG